MLRPVTAACALLLLAGAQAVPAQSSQSAFHIGHDIMVTAGESVHHAVCFLCSIQVEGTAEGDLLAVAGNVYLDGPSRGDVVALGSHVTMTGKSSIGGSLIVFGGRLYQAPGATISRRCIVLRPIVFLPIILLIAVIIAGLVYLLRYMLIREPVF